MRTLSLPVLAVAANLQGAPAFAHEVPDTFKQVFLDVSALDANNQSYVRGVLETTTKPVLFIDPDKLDKDNNVLAGRQLKEQLESQLPGSSEALQTFWQGIRNNNYGIENSQVPFNEMAQSFKNAGPSAIGGVPINGQIYGVVNLMPDNFDEKKEIVTLLSGAVNDGKDAIGSDADWARKIGRHEGNHVEDYDYSVITLDIIDDYVDELNDEIIADREALKGYGEEATRAFIDQRNLGASLYLYDGEARLHDVEHATGIFLENGGQATQAHVFAAHEFRESIDIYVEGKPESGDLTADEFLEKDPEAFFKFATEYAIAETEKARRNFQLNPSFKTLERTMIEQYKYEYAQAFQGAYRREILDQDYPPGAPSNLVPKSYENVYESALEKHLQEKQGQGACRAFAKVNSTDGLNMRVNADQDSEILAANDKGQSSALSFGDDVTIHSFKVSPLGTEWAQVSGPRGRTGYVSQRFLDIQPAACGLNNVPGDPF